MFRIFSALADAGGLLGALAAHSELPVGEGMILVREPDAGNPHGRFDERRLEPEPR